MISRAKILVHNHMEPARLPCYRQAPKWYQNEQRLFCIKDSKFVWISDFFSKKSGASEMTCSSCRQLLGSYKSGFDILARRTRHAPHATSTLFAQFDLQQFLLIFSNERKTRKDSSTSGGLAFECLEEILKSITHDELNKGFRAWMQQVQEASQGIRDYLR
jgi:hypothetical protein